jgi:hypothetical protein
MSILRYCIENVDFDANLMRFVMDGKHYKHEVITVRDAAFLTPSEYAVLNGRSEYAKFIDHELVVDYILNYEHLRKQLAYNSYDIAAVSVEGKSLYAYALDKCLNNLLSYCQQIESYQKSIAEFHEAVELNNFGSVQKKMNFFEDNNTCPNKTKLFIGNLIGSRTLKSSCSAIHRCVLNRQASILEFLLNNHDPEFMRFDYIRDHCYRTPLHYACGMLGDPSVAKILLDFGFTENVFDKDGMSPLDFQERAESDQVQDLIEIHRTQEFRTVPEPNPWTSEVWDTLQVSKNKRLVLADYFHSKQYYLSLFNPKAQHSHYCSHSHSQARINCGGSTAKAGNRDSGTCSLM